MSLNGAQVIVKFGKHRYSKFISVDRLRTSLKNCVTLYD